MSTLTPPKLAFVDFAEFAAFDQELLREIIREGEREMDARLVTANAADQRALTIAGFQLTLVIALTGATYALAYGEHPNLLLATITAFGVAGLGIAAYFSLFSVAPKKFKFPGNSPENWFSSLWHNPVKPEKAKLRDALVEECYCLYSCLYDNKIAMENNARSLRFSIFFSFWVVMGMCVAVMASLITSVIVT